jgi:hypothetical protein
MMSRRLQRHRCGRFVIARSDAAKQSRCERKPVRHGIATVPPRDDNLRRFAWRERLG